MRRQVWQDFLDWLRPVDRQGSAPEHGLNQAAGVSTDQVTRLALNGRTSNGGAFDQLDDRGTSTEHLGAFADEAVHEIDEDELLEFLAADHDPIPADPVFREQLRDQLWTLVQEGATSRPKDH